MRRSYQQSAFSSQLERFADAFTKTQRFLVLRQAQHERVFSVRPLLPFTLRLRWRYAQDERISPSRYAQFRRGRATTIECTASLPDL
jgi:hypothetical protein